MASFECHFCSFFVFLPKHFLPKVSAVYCCIMRCSVFLEVFLEELIVFEMHDRHLIVSVFFGAVVNWIEDKRHTSLVAALSFRRSLRAWRNDNQRRHSLPFSFLPFLFFFSFLLSISPGHSVLFVFPFLLSSHTISVPKPSPILACLRHLLSFSFCLSC